MGASEASRKNPLMAIGALVRVNLCEDSLQGWIVHGPKGR